MKVEIITFVIQLRVESVVVVTYDECQGNLLDHPTSWPFQHFVQMGKCL